MTREKVSGHTPGDSICGTCGGLPHPSGKVCICGGTGKAWSEAQGLRELLVQAGAENARKLEAAEGLAKAAEELLLMTDLYHNDTGHDVEGASMQGACDPICHAREPLRAALSSWRAAVSQSEGSK